MDIKAFAKKFLNFAGERRIAGTSDLGTHISPLATMSHYYQNNYENAYPSIRVITNEFAKVEPYVIDSSGNTVKSNILDRIYNPNRQMSAYDFREALAIMTLVHNKVYIRVHHNGETITAESITGFTFLEGVSEHLVNGKLEYWLPSGDHLTDAEIMILKSINPYNLSDGFSPAYAARRWTSLDDLIADFQTGFFDNNGVPAGQFLVTAKTATDYKDIVSNIRAHHQGAGKNNKVMFAHRPLDPASGKPVQAQIEWVPFAGNNKDMALKDLFEQANKKIDSTYGVPASMRGVNDNNTFASVRVDQLILHENCTHPFTLKIWQKINHELTRITGGTGVAISFDKPAPKLADEEEVKAKAKKTDSETLTGLTDAGYTLDSAIQYVKTGDISVLKQLPKEDKKPPILTPEELNDTPDQPADLNARLVRSSKAFDPEDRDKYEKQLERVVRGRMEAQIAAAESLISTKAVTETQPVDPEEDAKLASEMAAVILAVVAAQGAVDHVANLELVFAAGLNTDNVGPFIMSGIQRAGYENYLQRVGTSYNADTAERIRNVLEVSRTQSLTAGETRDLLRGLLAEDWRIDRVVRTEINKAGNQASLWSMQSIAQETGAQVVKVWAHGGSDSPCEFCRSLIGREVAIDADFVSLGGRVEGEDGGVFVNSFVPVDTGGLHPHCHCRQTYRVINGGED